MSRYCEEELSSNVYFFIAFKSNLQQNKKTVMAQPMGTRMNEKKKETIWTLYRHMSKMKPQKKG